MNCRVRLALLCAIGAALASPAGARSHYQLVAQGIQRAVTERGLAVTPDREFNVLMTEKGEELWTLDGRSLNDFRFYGGVADGKPIWPEHATRNKPKPHYPRFAATMTPEQIAALYEKTCRTANAFDEFTVAPVEAMSFAGAQGFRFAYTFRYEGRAVLRRGEAAGAVIGGKLVMLSYEAPALYFFERNLPAFRALVATTTVSPPKGR